MQGYPNNPNYPGIGNNRPGIGGGGGLFSPMDPSFRSEISLTIEFRVTSSMDDNKAPWVKVTYQKEQLSQLTFGASNVVSLSTTYNNTGHTED